MYIQATHAPCRPVTQPGRPFVGIGAMSLSTIDGWHIQGPIFLTNITTNLWSKIRYNAVMTNLRRC